MFLHPCATDNQIYCGGTTPTKPACYVQPAVIPLDRLAVTLVELIYGCFFQSYFLNCELKYCLSVHGNNDDSSRLSFLSQYYIKAAIYDLEHLNNDYFSGLMTGRILQPFIDIDIHRYLIEEKEYHFNVNHALLGEELNTIISTHSHVFQGLVTRYHGVITDHISKSQTSV